MAVTNPTYQHLLQAEQQPIPPEQLYELETAVTTTDTTTTTTTATTTTPIYSNVINDGDQAQDEAEPMYREAEPCDELTYQNAAAL